MSTGIKTIRMLPMMMNGLFISDYIILKN